MSKQNQEQRGPERHEARHTCTDEFPPYSNGCSACAADIPRTLQDYRDAPSRIGPCAYDWSDKPHRVLFDLCNAIEKGELVSAPQPPPEAANAPTKSPRKEWRVASWGYEDATVTNGVTTIKIEDSAYRRPLDQGGRPRQLAAKVAAALNEPSTSAPEGETEEECGCGRSKMVRGEGGGLYCPVCTAPEAPDVAVRYERDPKTGEVFTVQVEVARQEPTLHQRFLNWWQPWRQIHSFPHDDRALEDAWIAGFSEHNQITCAAIAETCKWTWNSRKEFWASECGDAVDLGDGEEAFTFQPSIKFCCFCGKEINHE